MTRLEIAKEKFAQFHTCYHPLEFCNFGNNNEVCCEVCGADEEAVLFDAEPLEFDDEAEMS